VQLWRGEAAYFPLRRNDCRRALCEIILLWFVIVERGWSSEATPLHHAHRRRGGHLAARGARTARRAQRRIGLLIPFAEDNPVGQARLTAIYSNWDGPRTGAVGQRGTRCLERQ
jgi:hypothetical protein